MPNNHIKQLQKTISSVHGDRGKQWWCNLPQFLDELAATHGLTLLPPFEH